MILQRTKDFLLLVLLAVLFPVLLAPSVLALTNVTVVAHLTLASGGEVTLEAHAFVSLLKISGHGVISPLEGVGNREMKGDFSRGVSPCLIKQYVRVQLEQGEVILDADSAGYTPSCVVLLGLVEGSRISIIANTSTGSITLMDSSRGITIGTGTGAITIGGGPCPPEVECP